MDMKNAHYEQEEDETIIKRLNMKNKSVIKKIIIVPTKKDFNLITLNKYYKHDLTSEIREGG